MAFEFERLVEVQVERMATGGEAVGHLPDGRVVFVRGALPAEVVRVDLTDQKKRFARGIARAVLEPAPERVVPACQHFVDGVCGGCDWMYIDHDAQREFKRRIVIEQLQRLGGLSTPDVCSVDGPRGRRTTVRCVVTGGLAGYRARRSDEGFAAASCSAAHPRLEELIIDGHFGDAGEVTLRVSLSTGDRMVITDGSAESVTVPDDVNIVQADQPGDAALVETVAGRRWRVSAKSFFQTSSTMAETLVGSVERLLAPTTGSVVDLYCGVGLLGGGAAPGRLVAAVESNRSSVTDARHNLGSRVDVVHRPVERWKPAPFDTVIADPARRGLAREGVDVIDRTGARWLVLVSCDPASLGRDTALLEEQGWRYDRGEVIDMFPDTSRIEVVSLFSR